MFTKVGHSLFIVHVVHQKATQIILTLTMHLKVILLKHE